MRGRTAHVHCDLLFFNDGHSLNHSELCGLEQSEGQRHTEHGEGTGLLRGLMSHPLGSVN